jgi:hypothetical protein
MASISVWDTDELLEFLSLTPQMRFTLQSIVEAKAILDNVDRPRHNDSM